MSTSSSPTVDDVTQQRIELAWKLIIEQYYDKAKSTAEQEGPGVSIFRLFREMKCERYNCHYYYGEKDGHVWKMMIDLSPDGKKIEEMYDPASFLLICIQIPLGTEGDETTGNLKLINIQTKQEHTPWKKEGVSITHESSGLRKRNTYEAVSSQ